MVLIEPYTHCMRSSEGLRRVIQRCIEEQVSRWDPEQLVGVLQDDCGKQKPDQRNTGSAET